MSRTIIYTCENCPYEETWTSKEDVTYNFKTCEFCELIFCVDCTDEHVKKEF